MVSFSIYYSQGSPSVFALIALGWYQPTEVPTTVQSQRTETTVATAHHQSRPRQLRGDYEQRSPGRSRPPSRQRRKKFCRRRTWTWTGTGVAWRGALSWHRSFLAKSPRRVVFFLSSQKYWTIKEEEEEEEADR